MVEKIILRPIEQEDLNYLVKWRNDEDIFSQLGGGYFPVSKTEMAQWMPNFCKNDKANVRFIIQMENKPVGYISLTNINYINRNAELGIYLGEQNCRGKGIASQALKQLESFASNHLGLFKIKLLVNSKNTAAIRMYKKNDYEYVGTYQKERLINKEWLDVDIMEKVI